ncbi:hypothetical protein BGZ97_012837 [Linnemannia gamsii]|uniref:Uncharacterized protein n=1 Tax=Linnemannia gamsii TaxID=64522 RepID=A0A9P6R077_9FUNG|nr:hypothetical protein BGZ97_012837 [Linnemannia gamsii]
MFTFKKINLTTIQIGRFKITRYRRKRQAQTPNTTDATGANNSRQPEALLTLGFDIVNPLATPTPSPSLADSHASQSQSRHVIFQKTVPASTPVSDTQVSPSVSTATTSLLSPDTTATSTPTSTTTSTPPPTSTSAEDEFWETNNRLGVLRKLRMSVFDFKVPTMTPLDHPDFWPSQLRDVVDIQSDYDETMSRPSNHIDSRTKQFWQEVKHDFREQVDNNEEWVLPRFDERGARVFRNPNNQKALENSRAHHAQENQDYPRQHQPQSQQPRSHQQWPQQPGSHNDSHLINHNNPQNGNKRLYPLNHSEIHTVAHPQNHRYIPHDRFPHYQHSQQWGQQQQPSQQYGQHFHGYQQPYGQNHHIEQHGYRNQRYQQHIDQQQSYHQAQRPNQPKP